MNPRLPCLIVLLASLVNGSAEQDVIMSELALKADALVNLPRYVEWPSGTFVTPETPVMLGVYGQSSIHKALIDQVGDRRLNGRRVIVRQFNWPQTPNCHLLFIADTDRKRLPAILKKVEHSTTLTVSELDDFLVQGGILRISIKEDKVRFHVSTTAANQVGLKFSSRFLAVADQVAGQP